LKPVKEKHFRPNYGRELNKTKTMNKKVEFEGEKIDGNNKYELKYFLTER